MHVYTHTWSLHVFPWYKESVDHITCGEKTHEDLRVFSVARKRNQFETSS
jgi:hypothetical protein